MIAVSSRRSRSRSRSTRRRRRASSSTGSAPSIFTTGFRPDYASWLPRQAFDPLGFPLHRDGASTAVPGLFFLGTHFLRKRKSSLLIGVGEDAAIVARRIAAG